jgi:putative redox protein
VFLASIGTCAGIYVLGFCNKRNLPTDGIKILERINSNPTTGMVDSIDLEIRVPESFPEKYYPALVRSAEQCKVKQHFEKPPVFNVFTKVSK